MCRNCLGDAHMIADLFGYSRYDPFGFDSFGGGDVNRNNFAPVSARARDALENAKRIFFQHLATVDTSNGEVTTEIIKFHLVPDMRKSFNKFVKEYGCTGTSRQLTRAEQDLVNKTRRSLLWYTSVKVTPQAQQEYLVKHPQHVQSTSAPIAPVASGSNTAAGSSNSVSTSGPLKDISQQKLKSKLNEAAVAHAASNTTVKKLSHKKKA